MRQREVVLGFASCREPNGGLKSDLLTLGGRHQRFRKKRSIRQRKPYPSFTLKMSSTIKIAGYDWLGNHLGGLGVRIMRRHPSDGKLVRYG